MVNTTGEKYSGRKKGTPNKMTKELRSVLKDLEVLKEKLDELETKERLEVLIKLMPYALPKVETIYYTINEPLDWN